METQTLRITVPARQEAVSNTILINSLKRICESRIRVFSYFPLAISPEKWEAINEIQLLLAEAEKTINWRLQLKYCLRSELAFHVIADRRTTTFLKSYKSELDAIMRSCREQLGLKRQY